MGLLYVISAEGTRSSSLCSYQELSNILELS